VGGVSGIRYFVTFTLAEFLSLSDDELAQLEELRGDLALTAAWWRRRRRGAA